MSGRISVSVVMPCWNAERWLAEAIDSVLAQTYQLKELIVIDDGSDDGSMDVIRSFGDAVRWEATARRGGAAARNRGLALARGDYVLFLDADDALLTPMLERMAVAAAAHPGSAPLCDREDVIEEMTARPRPHLNRYDGRDPLVFFLEASPQTSAVLHRRTDLLAVGGFDERLPCCQERDLHLRLAMRGIRLVAVPEILFRVRRRAGSVSSSYLRVLAERVGLHMRLKNDLETNDQMSPERGRALARALSRDARHLVRFGEVQLAERAFAHAARIVPQGDRSAFQSRAGRAVAALLGPVRAERLARRVAAVPSFQVEP